MQLPFIKNCINDNTQIIPIIVGDINDNNSKSYSKILQKYYDEPENFFIFSSDFCHWGNNFDYFYYNKEDGNIHDSIKKLDKIGINLIKSHDYKSFDNYLNKTENTICGRNPIKILLKLIENSKTGLKTDLLHYDQSNKVKKFENSSVSYASILTFN